MNWAKEFRKFRQQRDLTQRELATALEMSIRGIRFIESGKREPRWTTVEKFKGLRQKYLIEEFAWHTRN